MLTKTKVLGVIMRSVPEADWKKLRTMKDKILQEACKKIFKKITDIIDGREHDRHKAYLDLWKTLKKEDNEISIMFDDLKRSNAIYKLAAWKRNGLVADDDWNKFSEQTRETIDVINQIQR